MMTAATADLQKAIFAALLADSGLVAVLGGGKVFDHAPASAAFPYVTLGRASVYDWSTAPEPGNERSKRPDTLPLPLLLPWPRLLDCEPPPPLAPWP